MKQKEFVIAKKIYPIQQFFLQNLCVFIIFLFFSLPFSLHATGTLQEVEAFYRQIKDKPVAIADITQCKGITDILEEAIPANQANKDILLKIYPILIECYGRQARYPETYKAMKQYAEFQYPQDKEKQAEYLKEQADELKNQEEITGTIVLYRSIAKGYSETQIAPEVYFQIAKIIREEETKQQAIIQTVKEYENIIQKYPKSKFAEESYFIIVKEYQKNEKYPQAIEKSICFLKNYPESKYYESSLFLLGFIYQKIKKENEARRVWEKYLKEYPEGQYSSIIKTFYGRGEKKIPRS